MRKIMYPCARHKTAFSRAVTLTDTTYAPTTHVAAVRALRLMTAPLHTAACRPEHLRETSSYVCGSRHNVFMQRTLHPLYLLCLSPARGNSWSDKSTSLTDGVRSPGDTRLRTRRKWRYRARTNCGLTQQDFDRLVTHRP
jgi:hypothetical protein